MLKGKACINCRRRKIKCDGNQPSCGQCARSNGTFEDCEYLGNGPTQTQILEEKIFHIQSRIHELEKPREPISIPSNRLHSSDLLTHSTLDANLAGPSSDVCSSPPLSDSPSLSSTSVSLESIQEPPTNIILLLIETFYHHSRRLGFFLNIERFHQSFLLPLPMGHHARPSPALLNAVYLWGSHLSPLLSEGYDEKGFLRNALYHLSKDLSSSHPYKVIHGIQAEVLLSYYYLKHGKVLGGNYHANAAVSLALSSGLHRIRTPESLNLSTGSPSSTTLTLPSPADSTEEGERIDAFWTVLILNNCWVAIQESHSMFYDLQNITVDTPWPMDTIEYQMHLLPQVSSGTIKRFLENASIEGFSVLALQAKAAVLLEQATVFQPYDTLSEPSTLAAGEQTATQLDAFSHLDMLIDQFKSQFPLLDRMDVQPMDWETLLVVQMMTHAATIKLHLPLSDAGNVHSRDKALFAAQSITLLTHSIIPTGPIKVDPILGVLWTSACEILMQEIARVGPENSAKWTTLLHSILSQMTNFSTNNAFMNFLLKRLRKNDATAMTF